MQQNEKDGIRAIQQAYITRFPEKSAELIRGFDMDRIRNMFAMVDGDTDFIVGIISAMKKTASGEVPGWAYIDTVIKNEWQKKTAPEKAKTEADILAMCDLAIRSQMYLNITDAIISDILPPIDDKAEEVRYLTGFNDPNILKVLKSLHEDGRITDEMLADGIRGHDLLTGKLVETKLKHVGEAITEMPNITGGDLK